MTKSRQVPLLFIYLLNGHFSSHARLFHFPSSVMKRELTKELEPKPKRSRTDLNRNSYTADWLLDRWLQVPSIPDPILESIEPSDHPHCADLDSMDTPSGSPSRASRGTSRITTSCPKYRDTLMKNGVIIDNIGTKMPAAVHELVAAYVLKGRLSPPLEKDTKSSILQRIQRVWSQGESSVHRIVNEPRLFPIHDIVGIAEGSDAIWSVDALPHREDWTGDLIRPKTDRHFGFPPLLESTWDKAELIAAEHPLVQPYAQATRENLFPSFLIEVKAEATGGTLYAAENQLAGAGAHRVNSLLRILDQIDPNRPRCSSDSLVFSVAVSQRQADAYVHYYNPEDDLFYMSGIDTFPFLKDIQGCHNFVKNAVDWLLDIQQPIVRAALQKLHPMTRVWDSEARTNDGRRDGREYVSS